VIKVTYSEDTINFALPKTFFKDATLRKFLKYIRILEIVNKSTASDEEIEKIVKSVKEIGKKEIENLLNEK
jgi:hypothetical protein